jgi:hypothetical protein
MLFSVLIQCYHSRPKQGCKKERNCYLDVIIDVIIMVFERDKVFSVGNGCLALASKGLRDESVTCKCKPHEGLKIRKRAAAG